MAKKFGKALHHGRAKRTKRNRDGMSWDSTEGAAVKPGQTGGYSGTGTVLHTKPGKHGRASHTAAKK
jgi:hypothetical protein